MFQQVEAWFQSQPHYEGLPFVGRRRLRSFLARWYDDSDLFSFPQQFPRDESPVVPAWEKPWEEASPDDDDGVGAFFREYFQSQEESYHAMLRCLGQVSSHVNYWLDWSTPVRRRPHWLYHAARKASAGYLALLGRRKQILQPEKTAAQFTRLNEELSRLTAFIQVSSFDLLSAEHATAEDRADALRKALQTLAIQARTAGLIATALSSELGKTQQNAVLRRLAFQETVPESDTLPQMARIPSGNLGTPASSTRNVRAFSDDLGTPCNAARKPDSIRALVKTSRQRLQESELALQVLVKSLANFINHAGRLENFHRTLPFYGVMTAGLLCVAARLRIQDSKSREALVQRARDVCAQFFREWVFSPLDQFWSEFLLRHPKEGLLVQLRELAAEESSLERMADTFASKARQDIEFAGESLKDCKSNLELPELYFEWSMQNPLNTVLRGHLLASCMVQSQKLKVLLYASLYSIDCVMTQLKWDFLMAGIMPMMTLCGVSYWIVSGFRRRRLRESRQKMVRALAEVDRYLNHHSQDLAPVRQPPGDLSMNSVRSERFRFGDLSVSLLNTGIMRVTDFGSAELQKVGEALGHLDALYCLASRVRLEDSDWRAFRRDILDLASPELSVDQKLHVVATMRGTYHVFDLGL
eukprot:TRINITY_DN90126_c0_g1_i1.p1 TRINITY_DN90126_c0_g1~~TRINITY_DN90126_c0_g1_i1.p1  ORF type:complete len:643 (+),score=91.72 TRINITY_DN90126_c0_g1_i1:251-2179(+)